MTAENGNGELRQLLEIKRAYRRDLTSFEEELTSRYEGELADGKKRLKERYLENVVDTVFADPAPVKTVPKAVAPTATAEPESPKCPECETSVAEGDKFCAECACPLIEEPEKEADMSEWPVASAGRKFRPRRR